MKTLLKVLKIITKFVYCIIAGLQLLSLLLMTEPGTYNQPKVIDTVTVYKPDYGNIHPPYTIPHGVIRGLYQLKYLICFPKSLSKIYYFYVIFVICLNSISGMWLL